MSLRKQVTKSLFWTFSDQVIVQLANILFGLYIARLLGPASFGITGIVLMFTNFAQLFIDMGFGSAIIHNQRLNATHYSSVFWLNCFFAIGLYFLFYFASNWLALFFNQPILGIVVKVSSLTLILNALCVVQFSLLIKELNFKRKAIINWISLFFGYAVAITMALKGDGVWAVVGMYLTNSIINVIVIWSTANWRPNLRFNKQALQTIWGYGIHAFGDNALNYWSRNFDNFIIGKCLGTVQLGIYTRAYSLMLLPVKNLSTVIAKVFFPAFSQRQNDISLLALNYLKLIKYIALITFPLLIGLALISKEFVLLFLGQEWREMIPVLSLLCIVGAIQSIVTLNGIIYYALGKTKIAFRISIMVNVVLILSFIIGVNFGILGVAWSYLIANILLFYPVYTTAISVLAIKLVDVFAVLKNIVLAVMIMVVCVCILNQTIYFGLVIDFVLKIAIGFLAYFSSLYFLERKFITQLIVKSRTLFQKFNYENS